VRRYWKVLALAAIVSSSVILGLAGAFDSFLGPDRVRDALEGSGAWGRALYVASFTLLQPLSAPGALLIIPATFVWPGWQVFLLSWLGGIIASAIGFYVARSLGKEWVDERLPPRFKQWDRRLAEHGILAVIGLRILTGFAPPADWLLGVSSATRRQFWIGSVIGLSFQSATMGFFGDEGTRLIGRFIVWIVVAAIVLAVAAAAYWYLQLRRRNALEA
jgi:uncharacterized membrane protein YdjX (TVP38/TMEM64 family)